MTTLTKLLVQDVLILTVALVVSMPGPLLGICLGSLMPARKQSGDSVVMEPLSPVWPWSLGSGVFVNFVALLGSCYYFTTGLGGSQAALVIPFFILFCVAGSSAGACVITAGLQAILRANRSLNPPQRRLGGKFKVAGVNASMLVAAILFGAVAVGWYVWRKPLAVRLDAIEARNAIERDIERRIHPSFHLFSSRLVIESYPKSMDPTLIDDAAFKAAQSQTRAEGISLEMISLGRTRVTDEVMVLIGKEMRLVDLYLDNTQITDQGLKQIQSLPQLCSLSLADTLITDEGLAVLLSLPRLEQLNLSGTKVSDAAVDLLLQCPNLRRVQVERTSLTPSGIQRLLSHLHNVERRSAP